MPTPPRPAAAMPRQTANPDLAAELARVERIANLLDARFRLFGFRFGLDGLLGLLPVVGDTATLLPSAYIVWRAWKLGASRATLVRMAGNTGLDYVIGTIPLLGDLFDVGFKANLRNAGLLRDHILSQSGPDVSRPGG